MEKEKEKVRHMSVWKKKTLHEVKLIKKICDKHEKW